MVAAKPTQDVVDRLVRQEETIRRAREELRAIPFKARTRQEMVDALTDLLNDLDAAA